ncbi:MAG: DPP IV N-terminal domain-containing protein [Proteobacteria bacterium]|nr:DPP IV N-terminal domain-containing protein [Pseudomonadota bacterium]
MQSIKHSLLILFMVSFLGACGEDETRTRATPLRDDQLLTLEAIFKDEAFEPEEPGTIRWLEDGSGYTALETAEAYADAELEKDEDGEDIKAPEDIIFYAPETTARSVLISVQQLTPEGAERALIIDDYHWSDDRSKLLVYTNSKKVWRTKSRGDYWILDIASGELWQLGGSEAEPSTLMFAKFSPDATQVAYVRVDNIYVQDLESGSIDQLTSDASDTIINGLFDWVYEEEFQIKDGFRWSPDGKSIAYWQLDTSAAQDFILINNTDALYPTISRFPYPKVGEENSAARVGVVSLMSKETVWAKLPGIAKDMYIPRMDWANNSEQIIVQHLNRKQDTNDVYYADAKTGELTTVLIEKEQAFIEDVIDVTWFDEEDAFTWISERSGWRHIYRVSRDGRSIVDLTPGDFDIVSMSVIDEASGWLYFIASPDDMAQRYLYQTRLDGSGEMTRVTPDEYSGFNSYQISKDARWAIHTHASFSQPPQYRLVSLPDHEVRHVLEDNQELIDKLANMALGEHEFFQVEAQDGLILDGFIMRPPNFDPSKKYPVINYVYGDPAGQTVRDNWFGPRHLWHMVLTQKGFVVASVDNRGTRAPRGREWRKSIYGAVGVLGSRDQSDALAAMAKRWDYIDTDRIGVWGHSGGGSMTLNLMFRFPKQYHVGISRAPVADQRLYDSIYQERYSGLLDEYEEGYRQGSPITFASQLEGKLLLIHGTGDDNVHYQGTERLINELVKHNRQFDFMSYPNRSHSLDEGEGTELHMYTLMTNYFVEHLRPQ